MSATLADVAPYLRRLGHDQPPAPTPSTPRALQARHLAAFPLEPLSTLLRLPVPLDLPSIERKLLHDDRGGYCYELNRLFLALLLTMVTFILALIPFGTPVSYLGVGLWLFAQGQTVEAIGVIVWGLLIVSSSDNVIRPLVISGATQIPFLLIMFGVLGGIASFGLVGLFIGPVILAILLAIWREWLHENVEEPVATLETPSETK